MKALRKHKDQLFFIFCCFRFFCSFVGLRLIPVAFINKSRTNSHVERVQLTVGPNYFINKSDLLINNLDLKSYLLHPNSAQFNPNSAYNVHLGYLVAESQKVATLPPTLNTNQTWTLRHGDFYPSKHQHITDVRGTNTSTAPPICP